MEAHRNSMNILLLTQEQCGFCTQAKEIINRLAVEYPLAVTMLDLHSPEGQALALSGGILFPPGIFLDGSPFSYGRLSERKLRRAIERRLRERTHDIPAL
jgi:glutaredoxin